MMTTRRTLKKWFQDPRKNVNKIIEDRLAWTIDRLEMLIDQGDEQGARALYEEYSEWTLTEDDDVYGFLILSQLSNY